MEHVSYSEPPMCDNPDEQFENELLDLLEQPSLSQSCEEQPSIDDLLLYDGQVYRSTDISLHQLLCKSIPYVEAEVFQSMDNDEEEDEQQEEGPHYLIFNGVVYEKDEMKPWDVDDIVTRVTAATVPLYHSDKPVFNRHRAPVKAPRNRTTAVAAGPVVHQLPYGFDLAEHERSQGSFTTPSKKNSYPSKLNRVRWTEGQMAYLWILIDLALGHVKRPLEYRDFGPITEALHRRFKGTFNKPGVSYPIRGWNNVHSHIFKTHLAEYEEIERSILGAGSNGVDT